MMMKLNQLQRTQARKDLEAMHDANVKIQGMGMVSSEIKSFIAAQIRVLDTIAIALGVFELTED
jgi:hypothetical protein